MKRVLRALWGTRWAMPSHRGRYVACWGVVYLMLSLLLFREAAADPIVSRILHLWVPTRWWATYAMIGGCWSLLAAFRRDASSVPPFVLLSTLVGGRAIGHIFATVLIPGVVQLPAALLWAMVTLSHVIVARWPNPQPARLDPVVVSEALVAIVADKIIAKENETDQEQMIRIVEEETE